MERFPPVDFDGFHRALAPRIAGRQALALEGVRAASPLTLMVDGRTATYVPDGDVIGLAIGEPTPSGAVVELTRGAFSDFANELRTCFGLTIGDQVTYRRGDVSDLIRWEPALRALWHGRPVYDDETLDALDGVELSRSFSLDDDPAGVADFLARTGFVHVRSVFSTGEIDEMRAEVERLRGEASFDDDRSWWAKTSGGRDVCCRLIYASQRSPRLAAACNDDRLRRLVDLTGHDVRLSTDRLDGPSVVIKHPDVVEGLADLPWHRDCSMGGHPVLCPGVNVGIQLDPATPANGQLHFLAGSWRSSTFFPRPGDAERLPAVPVTTEAGDVTMHLGHTLHAAPPPDGQHDGRRTLYATFVPPVAFEVVEPFKGYNDSVLAKRGRVTL